MAVEFWTSGAAVGPNGVRKLAPRLETAGWDGITMVDSQNLATDPYVWLALASTVTDKLGLMTSVTNVVTRHAAVTAGSALTLQSISQGRFCLGIGRGDSALAHVGLAPGRLTWFDQYLKNLAAFVSGGEVPMEDLKMPDHIAPPVAGLGLAERPETSSIQWAAKVERVPVEVAATGPKVIAAAARHADRIIFALGADPARVGWGIETARQAALDAGRDPATLKFGAYTNVVCHDDVAKARELGRGSTSLFARFSAMHGTVASPADDAQTEVFRAVHDAYDMNRHAHGDGAQTTVLTDEFMETFAVMGSQDYCVDRLGSLIDLGVEKFCVVGASPAAKDPESAAAAERFIGEVAPQLR